ncbi:MAG: hypothetical protein PHS17_08175, partial [Desulfobacterales bacterium]|nr:hypothetical protein [Desulfobacterales bacterium]
VSGGLGADYDKTDISEVATNVRDAEEAAKDEVWGGYRYIVIADRKEPDDIKTIDLGAGHASGAETLCGRIIAALKSQALLNEAVGAGYIERNWPPALKSSGAWPLSSLRQSFLDGSLTRLLDPDSTLRIKIVEFVAKGDFGLASGRIQDGRYQRIWFEQAVGSEEITFEPNVFLVTKAKAKELTVIAEPAGKKPDPPEPQPQPEPEPITPVEPISDPLPKTKTIHLTGNIPPEVWNRLGTKVIPKLRTGKDVAIEVKFSTTVDQTLSKNLESELIQLLQDLGMGENFRIE